MRWVQRKSSREDWFEPFRVKITSSSSCCCYEEARSYETWSRVSEVAIGSRKWRVLAEIGLLLWLWSMRLRTCLKGTLDPSSFIQTTVHPRLFIRASPFLLLSWAHLLAFTLAFQSELAASTRLSVRYPLTVETKWVEERSHSAIRRGTCSEPFPFWCHFRIRIETKSTPLIRIR